MDDTPADEPTVVGRMTIPEFVEMHSGDRVEYIDGKVVPLPPTYFPHGKVVCRAAVLIGNHIDGRELGHGTIGGTFVKAVTKDDPTRIRGADVCFYSYARVPKAKEWSAERWANPELVMEVFSPDNDTDYGMRERVAEYLANDVLTVVVLDFQDKTATVYTPAGESKLTRADTFEVPDILPGFAVPVAKFFA